MSHSRPTRETPYTVCWLTIQSSLVYILCINVNCESKAILSFFLSPTFLLIFLSYTYMIFYQFSFLTIMIFLYLLQNIMYPHSHVIMHSIQTGMFSANTIQLSSCKCYTILIWNLHYK